ncbi:Lrp/AsnC family transcriptional regulator [Fodinisporobacter ferrooxydans]|uniref:Lrp/AsnC family transcriptional regulator n=1 Tax=Fodinisporobacter ferrooxydans TaxID=2901836 RepID=A0ABY4CL20_9BACL|nr:Lrp/AsnC family transcriptional regulator [Alicyclobacillaceae bacterium MYW30-H2]
MSMHIENIDDLDLKIISHLQEDGRKSFKEIADDVGVTERTVRLRVSQLKENGIIQIVGVVSPIKLGLQVVAIVQIAIDEAELLNSIELLKEMPEVRFITWTTGEYQLLIQVVNHSLHSLLNFLKEKIKTIPNIRKTNVMLEMEVFKNEFRFVRNNQILGKENENGG